MPAFLSPIFAVAVLMLVSASNTHGIGWISFPTPVGELPHRSDMALAVFYDVFLFVLM